MGRRTYYQTTCHYRNEMTSSNGAARVAHNRNEAEYEVGKGGGAAAIAGNAVVKRSCRTVVGLIDLHQDRGRNIVQRAFTHGRERTGNARSGYLYMRGLGPGQAHPSVFGACPCSQAFSIADIPPRKYCYCDTSYRDFDARDRYSK